MSFKVHGPIKGRRKDNGEAFLDFDIASVDILWVVVVLSSLPYLTQKDAYLYVVKLVLTKAAVVQTLYLQSVCNHV